MTKISSTGETVTQIRADAAVVGVFQDEPLSGPAAQFDEASGGILSRLVEQKEVSGKHGEAAAILAPAAARVGQLLTVGLGKQQELDRGKVFQAAAVAAHRLAEKERDRVAYFFASDWPDDPVEAGICGAIAGCAGQDLYRKEKRLYPFGEILWSGASDAALSNGQILGETVNWVRRLVNEPPSEIYPASFAERAQRLAADVGLEIETWDEQRLEKEKCGALLGVARGSSRPPRLVIVQHHGGPPGAPVLGLVGKGVTFDSGGLSLKTAEHMKTMKCDMAGAATVLGAMSAIARLALPLHVVGLVGLVENMVSGDSYKVGDVLTARSGKTIEVLNTDAEGRLVLADLLSLAVDRGAAKIIDLATLTGSCMVALGTDVAGVMTNDQPWCDTVLSAAHACGEPVWQLPMFPEYREQIKSEVAEIKNVGEGRWGGAITAAKFLEEFVGERPWVHLDIAGPAFLEKAKPWLDAGGTGALLRTLVEVARGWTA